MGFGDDEIAYIRSQPLVRMATLGDGDQPDVVPLACEFDGEAFWVGGAETFLRTRKVRNIVAGRRRVALVFDDMPSFEPFVARGVRVYGTADDPVERDGIIGPGWYVRITPTESWSWNMAGEPAGDDWYPSSHRRH